ncbi:MAG: hypothetical protein AB7N65_19975 [Vicinamibacterales bacterium]
MSATRDVPFSTRDVRHHERLAANGVPALFIQAFAGQPITSPPRRR